MKCKLNVEFLSAVKSTSSFTICSSDVAMSIDDVDHLPSSDTSAHLPPSFHKKVV